MYDATFVRKDSFRQLYLNSNVVIISRYCCSYGRRDILALGKFTLNLTASPEQLSTHVYGLLKQLVTKSHLMPLTLDVMNTGKFQPQKDYVTNQLKTGLLQLSDHTLLLLDETALQPGQLNAEGMLHGVKGPGF